MNKTQKSELMALFPGNKKAGILDYVSGWDMIASRLMKGTKLECGFVSTNSITQGEQVATLWKDILSNDIQINFAHQSFMWESDSSKKAAVHCVILGFSSGQVNRNKILFHNDGMSAILHINPYLVDAPDILIERRSKPLYQVPSITKGCQPTDGGNLIIEDSELEEFLMKEPSSEKYIKRLMGAREFINNKKRWCLWLVDVDPKELRAMPLVMERVKKVREMRLNSSDIGTRKLADRPTQFRETYNPPSCVVIAEVSSQNRRYVPMDFIGDDVICTNKLQIIPDGTIFHFGVLISNVHMAWMRTVCGRLKSDYDYSQKIVYNNFPWPSPTDEQRQKIEATAQAILDVRAQYPDASLADLYDPLTMPLDLLKAHQANDRAVMQAYGMPIRETDEAACVAWLMRLYQEKVAELE